MVEGSIREEVLLVGAAGEPRGAGDTEDRFRHRHTRTPACFVGLALTKGPAYPSPLEPALVDSTWACREIDGAAAPLQDDGDLVEDAL